MNQNYRVTFKMKDISTNIEDDSVDLENYFRDLLISTVLPALGMELVPLTIEVKRARK